MHRAEEARAASGGAPVKYFGKWPFTRLLGMQARALVPRGCAVRSACARACRLGRRALTVAARAVLQEPVSVAMSLANLWAHARGFARLRSALPPAYPLRALWTGYALLNGNAWVWSAVFHVRDTRPTEALDYFSADALLVYALFAALVRVGGLARPRHWAPLAAALAAALGLHVHHMAFVRFDYGYNMCACVLLGVAHSLLWLCWAHATRHPQRGRLTAVLLAAHAASLLELLDFAPVAGALDAHALWHAATPAVTLAWYAFLAADARQHAAAVTKLARDS
jgi:hypothetical protein